jgi:hypothetical protein
MMRWTLAAATLLTLALASGGDARSSSPPPLYDPVILNIGFVCRWNAHCMDRQKDAMNRSLKFVRKKDPPTWRIQLCNRNAGRNGPRVDWVGFDNCIRNAQLTPPPPPPWRPKPRKRANRYIAERGR